MIKRVVQVLVVLTVFVSSSLSDDDVPKKTTFGLNPAFHINQNQGTLFRNVAENNQDTPPPGNLKIASAFLPYLPQIRNYIEALRAKYSKIAAEESNKADAAETALQKPHLTTINSGTLHGSVDTPQMHMDLPSDEVESKSNPVEQTTDTVSVKVIELQPDTTDEDDSTVPPSTPRPAENQEIGLRVKPWKISTGGSSNKADVKTALQKPQPTTINAGTLRRSVDTPQMHMDLYSVTSNSDEQTPDTTSVKITELQPDTDHEDDSTALPTTPKLTESQETTESPGNVEPPPSELSESESSEGKLPKDTATVVTLHDNHVKRVEIDNTPKDKNDNVKKDKTVITYTENVSESDNTEHLQNDTGADGNPTPVDVVTNSENRYFSTTKVRNKEEIIPGSDKDGKDNMLEKTEQRTTLLKTTDQRTQKKTYTSPDTELTNDTDSTENVSQTLTRTYSLRKTIEREPAEASSKGETPPTNRETLSTSLTNTQTHQKGKIDARTIRNRPYGFNFGLTPFGYFNNLLRSNWRRGTRTTSESAEPENVEILTNKTILRKEKNISTEDPEHNAKISEHHFTLAEKFLSWLTEKPGSVKVKPKQEPKTVPNYSPSECVKKGGRCYHIDTVFSRPARYLPDASCQERFRCFVVTW